MKNDSKALRNIVLISQLAICVMVPTFLCLALGIWLDKRFGTWFTVPLLFIGMAAGARNAYVLAMDTIRQEKLKKDKAQQDRLATVLYNLVESISYGAALRGDLC
mgnify:FL=1